jgi:hypothetical protein
MLERRVRRRVYRCVQQQVYHGQLAGGCRQIRPAFALDPAPRPRAAPAAVYRTVDSMSPAAAIPVPGVTG